MQYTHNFTIWT